MNPCNVVFALLVAGLPTLNPVSTFVLPLPVEIGTDIEFDIEITLPYTIIFPQAFGKKRRSISPSDTEAHSQYDVTVAKLSTMFQTVGITDVNCQRRLICKVHNDPTKYSPLSDIILQHIDARKSYVQEFENEVPQKFLQFWKAGAAGLHPNGNCAKVTEECEQDPDTAIDWILMNFLQSVKYMTGMKFK